MAIICINILYKKYLCSEVYRKQQYYIVLNVNAYFGLMKCRFLPTFPENKNYLNGIHLARLNLSLPRKG